MARARFHTTVTERASFRDCRRQWHLSTVENLARRGQVRWYLIYGDVMHAALEAYYTSDRNLTDMLAQFEVSWQLQDAQLQRDYGGLYSEGIEEEWYDYREKGETTLRYYDQFDKADPFFDEIIAVNIEERAFVEILGPDRMPLKGHPLLSGKIDVVGFRKGEDRPHVMDHKNLASAHASRALDMDDQLTGYCYLYWRLEDVLPLGATYNVLVKDPPKPPRVLKDGSLSKDRSQRTTYDLYLAAIKELGLPRGDYAEILGYLKEKGWSQFFLRETVQRSQEELEAFEERLYYEYQDMRRALRDPGFLYPNPGQRTCPTCAMLPLCQSIEEGGDAEFVREEMYEECEPRVIIPEGV